MRVGRGKVEKKTERIINADYIVNLSVFESGQAHKSQKHKMASGTRRPYVSVCVCEVGREAAALKGPMTNAFTME